VISVQDNQQTPHPPSTYRQPKTTSCRLLLWHNIPKQSTTNQAPRGHPLAPSSLLCVHQHPRAATAGRSRLLSIRVCVGASSKQPVDDLQCINKPETTTLSTNSDQISIIKINQQHIKTRERGLSVGNFYFSTSFIVGLHRYVVSSILS